MMTDLTKVGISIYFTTAVRANNHTKRLATGQTVNCARLIHSSAEWALHSFGGLHGSLHLNGLIRLFGSR